MKYDQLAAKIGNHLLCFGDPTSGKSTLVSELANYYKLLWISTDKGHTVIGKLSEEARANVDVIVLPDTRDYPVAIDTVRKLFRNESCHICDTHGMVDCNKCKSIVQATFTDWNFSKLDASSIVVLDHLSGVADSCQNLVTKDKPVDYKLQLDDWGAMQFHLKALMLNIQNAPYNIVCIAHAVEAILEDKSKKLMPQVGSDAFCRTVAKYFDHKVYTSVSSCEHKFGSMTTYERSVLTGSRTDIAIEGMEVPSLKPFFDGTIGEAPKMGRAAAASIALPNSTSSASTLDIASMLKGMK